MSIINKIQNKLNPKSNSSKNQLFIRKEGNRLVMTTIDIDEATNELKTFI